ncbi:MAG TPA: ABC transporter ATP-binding protein [Candidatus Omnitrophota bacterium]|nr:ABC transporter ATP-binding protein [Candidatus Omnitrophota bacterium]
MGLIEISGLIKKFGGTTAVDGVTLSIEPGEVLGLVGESGSGKSTLARLMIKLIGPTSGEIKYNGIGEVRRDCGIVFQDPRNSLNPRIKVGEAIAEPMVIHNIERRTESLERRTIELLEMVKLPADYAKRYPHELSGGERQRVGIARALSSSPKFLVLDEPVSALDVSTQVEILRLLKEIRTRLNLTCLFIAHDLLIIGYMCDRIAVMNAGKILETGTKEQIFKDPQNPYTKLLLASSPKI